MSSLLYPAGDVAIPEIQRLVGMLTGSSPKNLAQALKSGWVVEGYVQGLILGEPSEVTMASAEIAEFTSGTLSDAEALSTLQKLASQGPQAAGLLDGVGGKLALQLLLPVIQKWLVNWLTTGGLDNLINNIGKSPATPAAAV